MGFFFLKGFTVVFDSKNFFSSKKKIRKNNFFEVKNNRKSFEKKKIHGANRPYKLYISENTFLTFALIDKHFRKLPTVCISQAGQDIFY